LNCKAFRKDDLIWQKKKATRKSKSEKEINKNKISDHLLALVFIKFKPRPVLAKYLHELEKID